MLLLKTNLVWHLKIIHNGYKCIIRTDNKAISNFKVFVRCSTNNFIYIFQSPSKRFNCDIVANWAKNALNFELCSTPIFFSFLEPVLG